MKIYPELYELQNLVREKIDSIEERARKIGCFGDNLSGGYRDQSDLEKIAHLERCVTKLEQFSALLSILLTPTENL